MVPAMCSSILVFQYSSVLFYAVNAMFFILGFAELALVHNERPRAFFYLYCMIRFVRVIDIPSVWCAFVSKRRMRRILMWIISGLRGDADPSDRITYIGFKTPLCKFRRVRQKCHWPKPSEMLKIGCLSSFYQSTLCMQGHFSLSIHHRCLA